MGFIKIDKSLQKSEDISIFFSSLITDERNVLPKLTLPTIIKAKTRPGLDSTALANSIIARFKEAGIPNGPLSEGVLNSIEELVKIICEEVVDAIQNEMRVEVAVDQGMQIVSNGANSAGPVPSTGVNPKTHSATGVAR